MTFALLLLAMPLMIKVVSYLLRWYEVSGGDEVPSETAIGPQLARMVSGIPPFLLEYLATLCAYAIWLGETPYRLLTRPFRAAPAPLAGDRPVILVHGFFMTPWSLWYIRRGLVRAGMGPVYLLDYHPALGDIDGFVGQLSELVERVAPGGVVDVVSHSMGGLIAARYMGAHPGRVRRLVAIDTPFHGTRLWAMSVGRSLPQMRPGSTFLAETREGVAPALGRVTCIYSRFDQIVLPYRSSHLAGADNRLLDGLGHNALLTSPWVVRETVSALAQDNIQNTTTGHPPSCGDAPSSDVVR